MIIQKFLSCYTTTIDRQSKGIIEEQSNTSQVTDLDSRNVRFADARIALVIGLFHGIRYYFTQQTVNLLLPFVTSTHTL